MSALEELIKAVGPAEADRLYPMIARDVYRHLAKHLRDVSTDTGEPAARRQRAQTLLTLVESMDLKEDSWWLDVAGAV